MRKTLACCAALSAFVLAVPSAYAGGHHGHGKGDHNQDHTCQGGHNCNTYPPAPQPPKPPPPKPAPAPAPVPTTSNSTSNSSSSSSTTVNVTNTTNVVNVVSVSAPAGAPASTCPCPAAPVVKHRRARHCRSIGVTRYRRVWHHGRDCCGRYVRWYTYEKIRHHRRVCV